MRARPWIRLVCPLAVVVACLGPALAAESKVSSLDPKILEAIDRVMEPWSATDAPGAAVAVVRGEEIVFARGYGAADPERGIAIEPDTRFDAASVAKTFTGLGVALLVATGKVEVRDLDADLRESITEMRGLPAKITLRHLLHHTSGLRDWPGGIVLGGGSRDDRIDFDRILRFLAAQRALNHEPGHQYSYTNSGYVLLARWIELQTGESFPTWMRRSVFEPLGMESTVIPERPGVPLTGAAVGHRRIDGVWNRAPRNSSVWGGSSMWTTVLDLGRFMVEMNRRQALPSLSFRFIEQAGRKAGGGELAYGAGVALGKQDSRSFLGHDGGWSGFRTIWRWFPDDDVGVAILSNIRDFDVNSTVARIVDIVIDGDDGTAGEVSAPELSTDQRQRVIGRYRLQADLDIEVFEVHGRLRARGTGQGDFALISRSPSEMVSESGEVRYVFKLPRKGPATELVNHQNGRRRPAPRVEIEDGPLPDVENPQELRLLAGRYPLWTGTDVEVRVEDGALVVQATDEETFPARRVTRDRFFVEAYGAEIRFRRGTGGRAVGLTYRGLDRDRYPDVDPETLAPYAGVYRSPELFTEYRIAVDDEGLFTEHPHQGRIRLTLVEKNRFVGSKWCFGEVEFDGQGDAPRPRFRVTFKRLENVVFERVEDGPP